MYHMVDFGRKCFRGLGALELLSMEMKMRGVFISRHISYDGVGMKYIKIPATAELTYVYDLCCQMVKFFTQNLNGFF